MIYHFAQWLRCPGWSGRSDACLPYSPLSCMLCAAGSSLALKYGKVEAGMTLVRAPQPQSGGVQMKPRG